jgi:hypothetical protein
MATVDNTINLNNEQELINDEHETLRIGMYIRYAFIIFMIIWTFIISINKFYLSPAFPILFIPYGAFGLGYINSDRIANDKIEEGVFSATFIAMGLLISLPLLNYMSGKILGIDYGKDSKCEIDPVKKKASSELNHIIFLAMISTLLSYIHIWVDEDDRHVCKIIRSCFETIAVTLYIFALTIFFILT